MDRIDLETENEDIGVKGVCEEVIVILGYGNKLDKDGSNRGSLMEKRLVGLMNRKVQRCQM